MGFLCQPFRLVMAVLAVLLAAAPAALRAELEFSGYLQVGGRDFFLLTDPQAGATFGWLAQDDSVRGLRIAGYDSAEVAVALIGDTRVLKLALKQASAITGSESAVVATVTRFGALRDFQVETRSDAVDNHGRPVRVYRNPWFGAATTSIPLQPGLCFGFVATVSGLPKACAVEVECRFESPAKVGGSTTRVKTIATTDLFGRLVDQGVFHRLDNPDDLIPGIYRGELVYASRVLVAKEFTVGQSAAVPAGD